MFTALVIVIVIVVGEGRRCGQAGAGSGGCRGLAALSFCLVESEPGTGGPVKPQRGPPSEKWMEGPLDSSWEPGAEAGSCTWWPMGTFGFQSFSKPPLLAL